MGPVSFREAAGHDDRDSLVIRPRGTAPAEAADDRPVLAVIVVTYRAAAFITECLDSLVATRYPRLRIIVVDNASDDDTAAVVAAWRAGRAAGARPGEPEAILIEAGENLGFAAGVNRGIAEARRDPQCGLFWILNPDTVVAPQSPRALVRQARAMKRFAVIGARVIYRERPGTIQTDGGRLHPLCGTAVSVNIGAPVEACSPPDPRTLAYIPGVSMLASRAFVDRAGPMPEHWFLYFEEIDWQLRRGDLPLGIAPEAHVFHRAGATIGSGAVHRRASPLSIYFTCRNLLPFVRRHAPWRLPFAYLIPYYKLVRQWGPTPCNAMAVMRGLHGFGPPKAVRDRLPRATWARLNRPTRPHPNALQAVSGRSDDRPNG